MTLFEYNKKEMQNEKVMVPIEITKTAQENIIYLLEEFKCETTDELINLLLTYAATTAYTDRIISEVNK